MAVWGSYESGKELAQSGVGVLWAARPAGAPDSEERFVIKTNEGLLFLGDAEQTEQGSALFLESAKAQKALTDAGVPGWARILECGKTDAGAFYVADRYERSVQKIVVRGIKVGGAGLRQVVLGIVDALIVLRARASRPHGNLKTTNVLIGGPDGPTVDKDPIVLTDLKPGSTLAPKDAEEDVRAIGRLVYEMVMLRPPRDSVGLTVSMTSDWSRLGGAALAWIDFTNRLLDVTPGRALPDLVELREMIPSTGLAVTSGRKLPLLAVGGVLALMVAAGATFYFVNKGKTGTVAPPPPPPPRDAMKDDEWSALLSSIKNVLSKRSIFAKSLQADKALWNSVPPDVQDILNSTSMRMPWEFLPEPAKGWGDPYDTLAKPEGIPSKWNTPEGLFKGDANSLGEWRSKAEDLRKQAETVVQWINKLLPPEAQSEWGTATWETLGWTEQLDTLKRLQSVTTLKMGALKFAKDEDLAIAVRFSLQGGELGKATKALETSLKAIEGSDDEALKQFREAVKDYTKGAELKDLIARVEQCQKLAKDMGAKLADKSKWDYVEFTSRFKRQHAEKFSGGDVKLAFGDFVDWQTSADSKDFQLNEQATAEAHKRSADAKEKALAGLAEHKVAIDDPNRFAKFARQNLDPELIKKELTQATVDAEPLAQVKVFEWNRPAIALKLDELERRANQKDLIPRKGTVKTFAELRDKFTNQATSTLGPGFQDAMIKQIATKSSLTTLDDLEKAEESLGESWMVKLRELQDEAGKAMPGKFGQELGVDASMLDSVLSAQRTAALKAVGDSVAALPSDGDIKGVAALKPVAAYNDFRKKLAGIAAGVAKSSKLMRSGDLKADVDGNAALASIEQVDELKKLAAASPPNGLSAWKAEHDEIEKLRASLSDPEPASFDGARFGAAIKGATASDEVLNRVLLSWKLAIRLDAAGSVPDKTRLATLGDAAAIVLAKIDTLKPEAAIAQGIRNQINGDRAAIWLNYMARVAARSEGPEWAADFAAGRDLMSKFGLDEAKLDDPRLDAMPGTRYNIVLSRIKAAAAKLEPDPASKEKDEAVAAPARKKDADTVQKLLTQLQTVATKNGAPIAGVAEAKLLEELEMASKPSSKPVFKPEESGPKSPGVKDMVWTLVPSNPPSDDTVAYKWKTHELVFRKLEVEGQKETTYLCTREVSLGLFMEVAQAVGVAEGVVSTDGLTKLPEKADESDPDKIGPRVWSPKPGGGMTVATGAPNNLLGWYRLPAANADVRFFPSGLPFLPENSSVKVDAPSTDLPVQYITPASAILVAHRMGCRLPTRADFAKAAAGVELTGANLRDKTWNAVYQQTLGIPKLPKAREALAAQLQIKPCFPHAGIFQPVTKSPAATDSTFYEEVDDGTLFFRAAEPPASPTENFMDLIGNVAEFVVGTDDNSAELAEKMEQSFAGNKESWQDAIQKKVFIVGGSALSPPPGADKDKSYDNKTPYEYPTGKQYSSRGFSDVGFRLAFSAASGGGSPIDAAKKAIVAAKFAPVK